MRPTEDARAHPGPLDAVDPPEVAEKEMRFLDHEEVACPAEAVGDRHRAFVLVAAYCGPRPGELRGLRRRDIDLLHRTITLTQHLVDVQGGGFEFRPLKARRSRRSIAVPPHVAEALDRYGHLMPGQAESVAQRLSVAASEAIQMNSSGRAAPG